MSPRRAATFAAAQTAPTRRVAGAIVQFYEVIFLGHRFEGCLIVYQSLLAPGELSFHGRPSFISFSVGAVFSSDNNVKPLVSPSAYLVNTPPSRVRVHYTPTVAKGSVLHT
jgi:hypothetical protein